MTDSDFELMKLAAKAAGLKVSEHLPSRSLWVDGPRTWNPIEDDGDALRLAMKLRIRIAGSGQRVVAFYGLREFWADEEDEQFAATRRAIVRAAAEIGRAMK